MWNKGNPFLKKNNNTGTKEITEFSTQYRKTRVKSLDSSNLKITRFGFIGNLFFLCLDLWCNSRNKRLFRLAFCRLDFSVHKIKDFFVWPSAYFLKDWIPSGGCFLFLARTTSYERFKELVVKAGKYFKDQIIWNQIQSCTILIMKPKFLQINSFLFVLIAFSEWFNQQDHETFPKCHLNRSENLCRFCQLSH